MSAANAPVAAPPAGDVAATSPSAENAESEYSVARYAPAPEAPNPPSDGGGSQRSFHSSQYSDGGQPGGAGANDAGSMPGSARSGYSYDAPPSQLAASEYSAYGGAYDDPYGARKRSAPTSGATGEDGRTASGASTGATASGVSDRRTASQLSARVGGVATQQRQPALGDYEGGGTTVTSTTAAIVGELVQRRAAPHGEWPLGERPHGERPKGGERHPLRRSGAGGRAAVGVAACRNAPR